MNRLNPQWRVGAQSLVVFASLIAFSSHSASNALLQAPFRPYYHFTPERNWMNDPNGLVFYQGEYHLFFQHNPFGDRWGHMSWGHAVSRDLAHWQALPLALTEENGVMIFSGSAVVDWRNSSGFGQKGKPPMIAIYTGNRIADGRQFQCIAYSNDKGRSWTKFAGNPVLDIASRDFRDPKVFWHEPTQHWVMVVSLAVERKIRFYGSTNLKRWELLSEFGPAASTNGVWECPDMFPLTLENRAGSRRWVLIVNVGTGSVAGGSGTQYFVGGFDGKTFKLDEQQQRGDEANWVDYGRDFYAAVSWSDIPRADGRRLWLGWMSNWEYAQDVPTTPWRNAMSLPRQLSLREIDGHLRLVQKPALELQRLRSRHQVFKNGTVAEANLWLRKHAISGNSFEAFIELKPAPGGTVSGLRILKGSSDETVIGFNPATSRVFLDRTRSGDTSFHKSFAGSYEAPVSPRQGRVHLRLLVDACSVEVFCNEGERVLTALVFPSDDARQIECFGPDSAGLIGRLERWSLTSTPGNS